MTATDTIADLRRELEKAHDTLEVVQRHLAAVAEGNAALHCADRVIYSPLHAKVEATINGVRMALMVTSPDPGSDRFS